MTLVAIFIVNFIVFILALIGVVAAFFQRSWKRFVVLLVCVILTAAGVAVELSQWLLPPPAHEMPVFMRSPFTPL